MQTELGSAGIRTSALALGCARLGSVLTPLSRRASVALIAEAFELGVRHFDTASIYGQGDSERYLGEALRRRRDEVCLSSKAGQCLTPKQAMLARFKTPIRWLASQRRGLHQAVAEQRARGVPRDFRPDAIERSLHASLRRLGTDHLDIFYLHSPDPMVLTHEPLLRRIDQLHRQGLFRAFGVSCDDMATAWHAASHEAVQVLQFDFDGSAERHGLLRELSQRGKPAVLRGLMRAQPGATLAGEALHQRFAHTLQLPAVAGVIVGTTSAAHLRENIAAFRRALPSMEAAR